MFVQSLSQLVPKRPGTPNNDESFNNLTAEQWDDLVKQFYEVMTGWEQADDASLDKNANMIGTSGPTTPTHIGQIVFLRKEQGSLGPRNR